MKNYVIIVEVPKLKIPYNSSIKITDFKNDFFLYPYNIIKTIKKVNQNIKLYNSGKEDEAEHHMYHTDVVNVDRGARTYFISELEVNIEIQGEEILEVVKNHFKFLLNLFSFIFRELFYIKKVYIFEKQSTFYKFVRMIKIPIFHKETSNSSQLVQVVFRRDIENLFPILLLRLKKNKHYLPFIEEFLFSWIRAGNINVKFMVSWNTLEHLTNIYWKLRGKTKLFKSEKKQEINASIQNFQEEDIEFPYITPAEIEKRVSFFNRPPITTLIRELCKRIHLRIDDDEFLTIRQVHYIRNKLFHRIYDIRELNEDFSNKFNLNDFETKDYGNVIRKLMLILEKIILRLFQFIPACFQIKKVNDYFHYLEWKKIRVYSKIKEKDINEIILESRSENNNFHLRQFLEAKQKIFFKGKYISLLRLLNRLDKKLKNLLENSLIVGEVDTRIHGKRKILLQFKDNLKGIYCANREDDHVSVNFVRFSTPFISIPLKNNHGYQLKFELLVTQESSHHFFKKGQIKINGEFITLFMEIIKIN